MVVVMLMVIMMQGVVLVSSNPFGRTGGGGIG